MLPWVVSSGEGYACFYKLGVVARPAVQPRPPLSRSIVPVPGSISAWTPPRRRAYRPCIPAVIPHRSPGPGGRPRSAHPPGLSLFHLRSFDRRCLATIMEAAFELITARRASDVSVLAWRTVRVIAATALTPGRCESMLLLWPQLYAVAGAK